MSITNLADIAVAPILGLASAIAVPVVTRAGAVPIARINAVALNTAQDALSCEELRQRACTELLRQAAQDAGLLDAGDTASPDGVISEAAVTAFTAPNALRSMQGTCTRPPTGSHVMPR